ncbi:MAG: Endoglycoceramidase [Labilithrix sp.]|nr:Endoglycoceramidase [Labilithrix sp.]
MSVPVRRVLVALGAAGLIAACSRSGDDAAPPRPPRPSTFYVEDGAIHDPSGRTIIMRGVNLAGAHKQKPYLSDFQPADYARIRTDWGMNAVRFLVTWAAVEPTRGEYDEAYLAALDERIGWAHDAGLLVVLDMHQDLFGEGFNGDGAPRWTCDDARYAAFAPRTPWFFGYLDENLGACFDGLWTDGDLRGHLVEAWRRVALKLARHDNVIGFDPLNEPFWGTYPILSFEADRLAPFYMEVTRAVRAAAPSWLLFAEPSSSRNLGFGSSFPKLPVDGVVYAPHAYDNAAESGSGFDPSHRDAMIQKVADMRSEGDAMGAALFLGEYGGSADLPGIAAYMSAMFDAAGAAAASSTYWAYDKDSGYAILNKDGTEKKELVDALTRPYPERVAGRLVSYGFDANTRTATIMWETDASVDAPTEIVVPARVYPAGVVVECGGCAVEEIPGLVRLRSVPEGSPATVTIRAR